MNAPTASAYTVDDIHKMRLSVAERYSEMPPGEAERDFKAHVENAKRTMETLWEERRLAMNWGQDAGEVVDCCGAEQGAYSGKCAIRKKSV